MMWLRVLGEALRYDLGVMVHGDPAWTFTPLKKDENEGPFCKYKGYGRVTKDRDQVLGVNDFRLEALIEPVTVMAGGGRRATVFTLRVTPCCGHKGEVASLTSFIVFQKHATFGPNGRWRFVEGDPRTYQVLHTASPKPTMSIDDPKGEWMYRLPSR